MKLLERFTVEIGLRSLSLMIEISRRIEPRTKDKGIMKTKKIVLAAIAAAGLIALNGCSDKSEPAADQQKAQTTVGIVQLVEHPALDEANRGIVEAGTVAFIYVTGKGELADHHDISPCLGKGKIHLLILVRKTS